MRWKLYSPSSVALATLITVWGITVSPWVHAVKSSWYQDPEPAQLNIDQLLDICRRNAVNTLTLRDGEFKCPPPSPPSSAPVRASAPAPAASAPVVASIPSEPAIIASAPIPLPVSRASSSSRVISWSVWLEWPIASLPWIQWTAGDTIPDGAVTAPPKSDTWSVPWYLPLLSFPVIALIVWWGWKWKQVYDEYERTATVKTNTIDIRDLERALGELDMNDDTKVAEFIRSFLGSLRVMSDSTVTGFQIAGYYRVAGICFQKAILAPEGSGVRNTWKYAGIKLYKEGKRIFDEAISKWVDPLGAHPSADLVDFVMSISSIIGKPLKDVSDEYETQVLAIQEIATQQNNRTIWATRITLDEWYKGFVDGYERTYQRYIQGEPIIQEELPMLYLFMRGSLTLRKSVNLSPDELFQRWCVLYYIDWRILLPEQKKMWSIENWRFVSIIQVCYPWFQVKSFPQALSAIERARTHSKNVQEYLRHIKTITQNLNKLSTKET